MRATSLPTSHDGHGLVSSAEETVAVQLRCAGWIRDRGEAKGVAGLVPNGVVGELPPSTDVCSLKGSVARKSPNWRLAKLNSRRGGDGG